ncbi:hypothetical protein [Streptomyces sp.]|uniref:hypothetical protein n=1 Tax=Streptomyces sp. TaxID=1931 RepID=UPI002F9406F9
MTATLPHDPYITAVIEALTVAGLEPDSYWTSDAETDPYATGDDAGCTTMLSAVITWLGDDETDTSGLALLWDHPAGAWQAMPVDGHGVGEREAYYVPTLPQCADPLAVANAARQIRTSNPWKPTGLPAEPCGDWDQADSLRAAIATWEAS